MAPRHGVSCEPRIEPEIRSSDLPSPVPFDCEVSYREDGAVVTAAGELDLATAPVLLSAVRQQLSLPVDVIVVDFSAVSFLDSSGVQALVTLRREAKERSKRFAVEALQSQPRKVLKVLNLETFFV